MLNYTSVRVIFLIVLINIILILNIRYGLFIKRIIRISIIALFILICSFVWRYPIENMFFRFNTIEDSFKYAYGDNKIIKIINHDNYAAIFYIGDSFGEYFSQKDSRGWRIDSLYDAAYSGLYSCSLWLVYIGTNTRKDFDITLVTVTEFALEGNTPEVKSVTDSFNSDFKKFEYDGYGGQVIYYYTFAKINNKPYAIFVNDEKVVINE